MTLDTVILGVVYDVCNLCWVSQISPLCWVSLCSKCCGVKRFIRLTHRTIHLCLNDKDIVFKTLHFLCNLQRGPISKSVTCYIIPSWKDLPGTKFNLIEPITVSYEENNVLRLRFQFYGIFIGVNNHGILQARLFVTQALTSYSNI